MSSERQPRSGGASCVATSHARADKRDETTRATATPTPVATAKVSAELKVTLRSLVPSGGGSPRKCCHRAVITRRVTSTEIAAMPALRAFQASCFLASSTQATVGHGVMHIKTVPPLVCLQNGVGMKRGEMRRVCSSSVIVRFGSVTERRSSDSYGT